MPLPFREDDLWNGYPEETNAPYGLAKKMLLVQAQAYREQYGFDAITLLPVNLYGPGDNFDPQSSHVIPALIRKIVDAKLRGDDHIVAWGTGAASREFLYVEDAAEGIVLATERYDGGDRGEPGRGPRDRRARSGAGHRAAVRLSTARSAGTPRSRMGSRGACSIRRGRTERFGFDAATDFETGLQRTIDWYIDTVLATQQATRRVMRAVLEEEESPEQMDGMRPAA